MTEFKMKIVALPIRFFMIFSRFIETWIGNAFKAARDLREFFS